MRELDLHVLVLEAGDRPAGSWPHYYDSLRAFSPAAYSSMPGRPFSGDPDRYPTRDEVADYLEIGVILRQLGNVWASAQGGEDQFLGFARVGRQDRADELRPAQRKTPEPIDPGLCES